MKQTDHAANARGLRVVLEQNVVKLEALKREHGAHAYAAQQGDSGARSAAQKLRGQIAALEDTIAEQRAAIEAADGAAARVNEDRRDEGARLAVEAAAVALDEAEAAIVELEAALEKAAQLANVACEKRQRAFCLIAPYVGHERAYVIALHSLSAFVLGRFIRLAGYRGENPVEISEPLLQFVQQDHERFRCRLPDLLSALEAA